MASGYNRPEVGNTGSGVYGGLSTGSLVHLMSQQDESRLLVATVPEMALRPNPGIIFYVT